MRFARRCVLAIVLVATAARADDAATTEARAHFERGKRLYEVAKFQEALEAFTAAYETKALPDILFNIGQCHRRLGHWDAALFFYRGFLSYQADDSPDRAEAERLMKEVEAAKAAQAVAAAEAAKREELRLQAIARGERPAPLVDAGPPVYKRAWFWATVAGLVAVGTAVAVVVALFAGPTVLPSDSLGTIDARR